MTTQQRIPGKPEALRHRYAAEANLLSAHFEQPITADIKNQAHIVLPEDGKYTHQAAGPFQLFQLLSFGSGYTQVAGNQSAKVPGFTTLATSVIENFNVLDVVTADRVVGQIATVHSVDDGHVPAVNFLGTRFENLRISGNKIEVEQDLNILGPKPASGRSYFEDAGVRKRIAHQYEAIRKSRDLPTSAAKEVLADQYGMKMGKIKCSLVQNVHGAPGVSFGHVIDLADFGRIFLGELTVEQQDSSYTFLLSMIRMELNYAAQGTARVVNLACNGGPKAEVKSEKERAFDMKGHSPAQVVSPWFGVVTERLAELNLSTAMPNQEPSVDLIQKEFVALARDSGPTPELRRANMWSAALETHLRNAGDKRQPPRTALTTYGFFWTLEGVRLGVIHYLDPSVAFDANHPKPIEIMGWTFPVMIRPWLPTQHAGSSKLDGNCWVKFLDDNGVRQLGILTAGHVLIPGGIKRQAAVRFDVLRPTPPQGTIHRLSAKMDAALITIDEEEWGGKIAVKHSRVVGYKPIRLITGHGTVDADIVEHQGFAFATVPGESGKEPLNAVYMFFNNSGEQGDSGCLVIDLEFADDAGPRPYLLYLGKYGAPSGGMGYGLLIEQANKVWPLECFMNADPKRR
jgi:hypothetical protein